MQIPPEARIVRVTAFPDSEENLVEEGPSGRLSVYTRASAERGAANREIRLILARHLKVPAGRIRMLSGGQSRNKIFAVGR